MSTDYIGLMPFAATCGVRITTAEKDRVVGTLEHADDRTTAGGALHVGRSTIAVTTELHDSDGRLVAQTTQTQAVLARPS